ncbi:TPA: hypothetical protein HGT58_04895 [Escherichia coli]|nr:hypothetical protein [Escherichia coli]
MQLRAPWRVVTVEKLTHEQFNNTLPSLATDCASCTGWKSEGGVLLRSKCTRWKSEGGVLLRSKCTR